MTNQYGFGTTLQASYEEAIQRVKDALKMEGFVFLCLSFRIGTSYLEYFGAFTDY